MSDDVHQTVPALPDRYEPLGEIGRGGMGVVWRVRDRSLDRLLAVKIILPDAAESPEFQARFEREARITGSLQHPGIPPVVERGELADGSPFFSMKLVEGRTLAELLAARSEPSHDLPRFLGIFEQICQAVGYAHSRGVIHRDLKPANVMVGAFGEVQVMDWGMAKTTSGPGEVSPTSTVASNSTQIETRVLPPSGDTSEQATADFVTPSDATDLTVVPGTANECGDAPGNVESLLITDSDTAATPVLTQAGRVMGTPAYMPPEQARGEVDRLGARSDVFGLGAILCEILTGECPYVGEKIWQQAVRADLTGAFRRLDESRADRELIDLCKQCLAVEPAGRSADGSVVAEEIRRYEEGVQQRLQKEQTDRAAAEARAVEEQKRARVERSKRRVTLALASAVLLLTIGGGGAAWWYQQDKIAEETANEILAEQAANRANHARDDITSALARAAKLRDNYRFKAADTLLSQAEGRLSDIREPGKLTAMVQQAKADLNIVKALDEIRLRKATWTNDGFDNDFANGREGAYAQAFRDHGIPIFGGDSAEELGRRIVGSGIAESLLAALDNWVIDDPKSRPHVLAIARAADRDLFRNRLRDPVEYFDRQVLRELAEQADAASLSPAALHNLAVRLHSVGEESAASDLLNRATMQHPSDFWLQFYSAVVLQLRQIPRRLEAIGYYRAAIAIRPFNTAARVNIGALFEDIGQLKVAEAAYRRAIEIDPKHAVAHSNLGNLLRKAGQPKEAEAAYRRAIEIDQKNAGFRFNLGLLLHQTNQWKEAAAEFQRVIEIDPKLEYAHTYLGELLRKTGQRKAAEDHYRKAIKVFPKSAAMHFALGKLLREAGQRKRAENAFRRVIELDPKHARAHFNLGNLLSEAGRRKQAEIAFRRAIKLEPKNARAHANLGNQLKATGRTKEAEAEYRQAIKIDPTIGVTHYNLGTLLSETGERKQAVISLRRAIELDPKHAQARVNLAYLLRLNGQLKEAEAEYRQAIEILPKLVPARYNLGHLLITTGRMKEAEAEFRRAIKALPKNALMHYALGSILKGETGRRKQAETAFRRAIELDPKHPEALCSLGHLLSDRSDQYEEAVELLRRGHAIGSARANWRIPSARLLATAERLLAYDRKLSAIRNGQQSPANSAEALALADFALKRKHQPRVATKLYRSGLSDFRLPPSLRHKYQYNAACSALLCAGGKIENGAKPPDAAEAATLRKQALVWLKANLATWKRLMNANVKARAPGIKQLRHWLSDPDLVTVRDQVRLAALPANERKSWAELWRDVRSTIGPAAARRPRTSIGSKSPPE